MQHHLSCTILRFVKYAYFMTRWPSGKKVKVAIGLSFEMRIQFVKLTFPPKPWPRESVVQYFGLFTVLKGIGCFFLGFVLHAVSGNCLQINWWTIDDQIPDNCISACLSKCIFNRRSDCWSCLLRILRQNWVTLDRFALFMKHFLSYDVQLRLYTCKPRIGGCPFQ